MCTRVYPRRALVEAQRGIFCSPGQCGRVRVDRVCVVGAGGSRQHSV